MNRSPGSYSIPFAMELARQFMHVGVGLGCVFVLALTSLDVFRSFLVGLLGVGILLSLVARAGKWSLLTRVLSVVERPTEGMPGQGAFFFLIGVGIPAFLFSSEVVVLAGIIALTFQDAFSTMVGVRFGKTVLVRRKTLEGSLGGFIACAAGLLVILPLPVALAGALAATLVELAPFDDSFSIPLVAALVVVAMG